MKAKLYIRGADPVDLEEDEAKGAETLIADASKPKDTPFSIEGVWSGTKADMKFVAWQKDESSKEFIPALAYTKEEAEAFDKEFVPFIEKAKTEGYKSYDAMPLWLESLGCVRLSRWEGKDGRKFFTTAIASHMITPYNEALARKERRDAYYSKVAFAKKKETEALEKMADQTAVAKKV